MQRKREDRGNPNASGSWFDSLGGIGFRGSMFPSIFGEKDPFDDPFFTRPSSNLFRSHTFSSKSPDQLQQTNKFEGPVIKELDSDAEEVPEEDDVHGTAWSNRNPLVEHPEDQAEDDNRKILNMADDNRKILNMADDNRESTNNQIVSSTTHHDKAGGTQLRSKSVSFQRVTYGGINGAYYTATTSRRMGNDGVTLEESKQADRTTGQATHRVSRGIQDKGHSVTRKLDSDGKVDTVQTLHNLGEDELAGFEQAWGDSPSHGLDDAFNFPGFPGSGSSRLGQQVWGEFPGRSLRHRQQNPERNLQGQSGGSRTKKVVTINIE